MEFENLIKLIEAVSASELTSFQYEEKGLKLKLSKGQDKVQVVTEIPQAQTAQAVQIQTESIQRDVKASVPEGKIIRSPLVGTFYAAPSEDAESFVSVGDTVKKGQTLAIVEAMKLMNEIESEYDGVIEEILVENGQPVEYNQPLFRLK